MIKNTPIEFKTRNKNCDRWNCSELKDHYLRVLDSSWYRLVVSLQDLVSVLTATFWAEYGVQTIHLPVTTGSISSPMGLGSDSKPVKVDLFGIDTYLADSMQFCLEYGCRLVPKGCYYVMPSFRGEAPDSTHLCQFFHSEAEIPGTMDSVMRYVELYLRHLCLGIMNRYESEIFELGGRTEHIEHVCKGQNVFKAITFDEACSLLDSNLEYIRIGDAGWRALTRAGENRLTALLGDFVWVTHWDHLAVPFYQAFAVSNDAKAINADLLFGMGEVVGAGERHDNPEDVIRALRQHKVEAGEYQWYIELKDKYPMRTAGFGMGIERFLMWVLSHDDIRDFQILPRINGTQVLP